MSGDSRLVRSERFRSLLLSKLEDNQGSGELCIQTSSSNDALRLLSNVIGKDALLAAKSMFISARINEDSLNESSLSLLKETLSFLDPIEVVSAVEEELGDLSVLSAEWIRSLDLLSAIARPESARLSLLLLESADCFVRLYGANLIENIVDRRGELKEEEQDKLISLAAKETEENIQEKLLSVLVELEE